MHRNFRPMSCALQWTWQAILTALGLCLLPSPVHAGDSVQLIVGLDYIANVESELGELDVISTQLAVAYRMDRLKLKVSAPYLVQAVPVHSGRPDQTPEGTSTAPFRSGIGDTNVAVSYGVPVSGNLWIDVTGKVKFPTAPNSARIGTGGTDWSIHGEMTRYFGDSGVSIRLGKKFTGGSEMYALANPMFAGVGAFFTSGGSTIAVDYDRRDSLFEDGIDRDEVTLSFSHVLRPNLRFQTYGFVSLMSGRSDTGLGTQVVVRFGS